VNPLYEKLYWWNRLKEWQAIAEGRTNIAWTPHVAQMMVAIARMQYESWSAIYEADSARKP
jgi:hypothetical protein